MPALYFILSIKNPYYLISTIQVKGVSFHNLLCRYLTMLEFNYNTIYQNIRAVFCAVFFNNNFTVILGKHALPIIMPFAHIMFPSIKAFCSPFVGKMRFYRQRICGFDGQFFTANGAKVFVGFIRYLNVNSIFVLYLSNACFCVVLTRLWVKVFFITKGYYPLCSGLAWAE